MKILTMKYLKYNSLKIISIIVSFSLVMTSVHPLCAKGLFLAVPGSSELLSHGLKKGLVVEELSLKKVTLERDQLIAITENNIKLTLSKKPGNKWAMGIITEEKEVEQIQKIKTTILEKLTKHENREIQQFVMQAKQEMGFDLFKKMLPQGSPCKMYEFLKNKGKYVSEKEISDEIKLSIKYTVKPDLRTLYFLGLVRKEFREEEIVYQAISINKTEWEEIVEPILIKLGARPGKKEKEDAKNELIKKLNKFRAKQKKNFQKYAVDRTKRKFFDEVVVVSLGGVKGIGRSALYVKAGYTRFLIDAGQGIGENQPFMPRFDLADEGVDFILVSHPHIDHIGCLPEAVDLFGDIPIYVTAPVREKIRVQLKNRASIASRVLNYKDRGIELLADSSSRSIEDIGDIVNDRIRRTMRNIRTLKMDQFRKMSKEVKISFQNAGHLLEANTITICTPYENIFYTGDFSWVEGRTIKRIQYPKDITIDRLIIESTYGGRLHRGTRKQREEELIKIIKKVYKRNGTVLIPSFALGRSSEIALILAHYKRIGKLPKSLPVYIDGLSERMMRIDLKYAHLMPESTRKDLDYLLNKNESLIKRVRSDDMGDRIVNEPCCIIASSGMLLENSLSARYYAPRILSDPNNALILVGYQAEGMPGRKLLECDKGEIFVLGENEIPVNASVHLISFSSHADHDEIIQFIEGIRPQPQQVMIVHGEDLAKAAISNDLQYSKIFNGDIVIPTEEDETSLFTVSEEMKEERTQEFNAIRTQRKVELKAIFKKPPKDRRRRFIKEIPGIFGINYEDLTKEQRTKLIRIVRENERKDKSIGRMRIDFHQMRIDEGKESFWELVGGKHLKGSKKGIMSVPFMVGIALFGLTLLAVVFWHQIITFILNVRNYLASIDGVNLSPQELFGRLRLALNFTVVGSMNSDWHNGRGRSNSVNHRRSKDAQDRPSEKFKRYFCLLTSMRAPDMVHNTIIDIHKELGIEKTIRLVMEWASFPEISNITIRKEINKLQALSKGSKGEEIKRIQVAILGILMIKFLDTFVEEVLSGSLEKEFNCHNFLAFIENSKMGAKPIGKIKVSDSIIRKALHTIVHARPSRGVRWDEADFWYLPLHYIEIKRKGLRTGSILKSCKDILKSQ